MADGKSEHLFSLISQKVDEKNYGNDYEIRDLKIIETSNPSGTVVTFYANGEAIAEVHESIFIKVGKKEQSNVLLNTIISVAAGAAIGAATGGVGAAFSTAKAATFATGAAAGAAKGATASGLGAAAGGIKGKLLNYGESTRQEFTIDEFQHKFMRSGYTPVKIVLEHDKEVINQEGFVKFHFHTLNMYSLIESKESKQWFKDNLQTGSTTSGDNDTLEEEGGGEEILASFDKNKAQAMQVEVALSQDKGMLFVGDATAKRLRLQ
ncbi:13641_t:CDS:2 [Funneliformis geosporum]|uniref:13641_t:CDS:1 n=1 Tax=Funneliformis geosporum TaxID=1117311 RepID=A0A9W4X1F3_9GLOM|nr:13641_t:CDS:2 [Funneliformis geosporum]